MNYKDFMLAMQTIETDRHIDKDIVISALKEALEKATRKHIDIADVLVRVEIDEDTGKIQSFRQYKIVETVEDDELEISLEDARKINQNYQLEDTYDVEVTLQELGRPAALLAKNVLKQKIREAEKQGVYDEYASQLGEMVMGSIETVEEKFIIVNLGKTLALMPKAAQIPNENYYEGSKIRVVVTEVNKETKGAQVLVSRADTKLVRRLFEKEVPEIFQGIVEIKAIAREAGERTKMAVYSKNEDIDPIGACIGPRGSRVQVVIEELKGEKIDIFEWSDDLVALIRNALAPAQIAGVIPSPAQKGLIVIVEDDQLSLAIGKRGKNARLAVRLTGQKIDIKTLTEIEEMGIDYQHAMLEYTAELERERRMKEIEIETKESTVAEEVTTEIVAEEPTTIEEAVISEEITPVVEEVVPVKEKKVKRVKKELRERHEYVSKFERILDTPKTQEPKQKVRKKKTDVEEERKIRDLDLRKEKDYDIKPIYTDEELEKIRESEEVEVSNSWIENEIDFDEFDEYYD